MTRIRFLACLLSCLLVVGCASYKGAGTFDAYNEVVVAQINANLMTGGGSFSLSGQKTDMSCTGKALPPYIVPSAFSCAGQEGKLIATCSDGRQLEGIWTATSCTTGFGEGVDDQGNKFNFEFGLSDSEIEQVIAQKTDSVSDRPELPDYDPERHREKEGFATGTGFIVNNLGYILTNNHVISGAESIQVRLSSGEEYTAKLVKSDKVNDVALIKILANSNLPYLSLGASFNVSVGEEIMTIGYPLVQVQGQNVKVTFGRVNSKSGALDDVRFYQIDVPVQPGNSGGPVINKQGYVIGITTASLDSVAMYKESGALPQSVNYALKIDYATPILDNIETSRAQNTNQDFSLLIPQLKDAVVLVISK